MTGATLRAWFPRTTPTRVVGVRSGDEEVFAQLLNDWSRSMLLLARTFVSTEASAEEVVQDTWLAVIAGIDRFEGRSSLRTWVYRILVNTAKKRGVRESWSVPWSSLGGLDEHRGPTVDPALFRDADDEDPGGWRAFPQDWHSAERTVLAGEVPPCCIVHEPPYAPSWRRTWTGAEMSDLSCQEFVELVTDYFEGALDADTAMKFDEHRALCPGCETYLQQMHETVSRLGRIPIESLSEEMQSTLLSAFRDLRR